MNENHDFTLSPTGFRILAQGTALGIYVLIKCRLKACLIN